MNPSADTSSRLDPCHLLPRWCSVMSVPRCAWGDVREGDVLSQALNSCLALHIGTGHVGAGLELGQSTVGLACTKAASLRLGSCPYTLDGHNLVPGSSWGSQGRCSLSWWADHHSQDFAGVCVWWGDTHLPKEYGCAIARQGFLSTGFQDWQQSGTSFLVQDFFKMSIKEISEQGRCYMQLKTVLSFCGLAAKESGINTERYALPISVFPFSVAWICTASLKKWWVKFLYKQNLAGAGLKTDPFLGKLPLEQLSVAGRGATCSPSAWELLMKTSGSSQQWEKVTPPRRL